MRRLGPDEFADPAELKGLKVAGDAKALGTPAFEEYREALAAYSALCAAHGQYLAHNLLRVLLELYGEQHER